MKKLFLINLVLFISWSLFSQDGISYSIDNEIKKFLSPGDLEEYNQAYILFSQADKIKAEADKIQEEADNLKININVMRKSKRRKATKKYNELHEQALEKYNSAYVKYILGYKKLYKIFDKTLSDISLKIKSEEKAHFDRQTSLAQQSYKTAMSYVRKGVGEKKDKEEKYNYYKQAYSLFGRSVDYQKKAFKIYFDQVYAPKVESTVTQSKSVAVQKPEEKHQLVVLHDETAQSQQSKQRQPVVLHDEPVQTQKTQQPAAQPKRQQPTYIHNPPTNQSQPKQIYTQPKETVYFRVQVAASYVPLSQTKLRQIYAGRIFTEYDSYDGRYKYLTYERFQTYEQAHNFKYSCGVPGAFVVAYKNGKRVRDICQVVPCRR